MVAEGILRSTKTTIWGLIHALHLFSWYHHLHCELINKKELKQEIQVNLSLSSNISDDLDHYNYEEMVGHNQNKTLKQMTIPTYGLTT